MKDKSPILKEVAKILNRVIVNGLSGNRNDEKFIQEINKLYVLKGAEKYRDCPEVQYRVFPNKANSQHWDACVCNGTREIVEDILFEECDFFVEYAVKKHLRKFIPNQFGAWNLKTHLKDWKVRGKK